MSVKDLPWPVARRNKKPLSQRKFLHFHWDRGIISCGTTQIASCSFLLLIKQKDSWPLFTCTDIHSLLITDRYTRQRLLFPKKFRAALTSPFNKNSCCSDLTPRNSL